MDKKTARKPRANEWGIHQVWNNSVENRADWAVEPRERLWASELGKSPIDIFFKLRGIEPSNQPSARAKRKFEAGLMTEWVVSLILKRAGILKTSQERIELTYPGCLPVTGKIDFIAGGIPDEEYWRKELEGLELPEFFAERAKIILDYLRETYPEGLSDQPIEIKSCSSFMMNAMEVTKRASKNHRMQLFTYLKAKVFPRGKVTYICRDDLRMLEITVENPSETEKEHKELVEMYSKYYFDNKDKPVDSFLLKPDSEDVLKWEYNPQKDPALPALEKNIVFDEDLGKFSRNWNVEYSSYLTMLYGFIDQAEFEDAVMPVVGRWNRVMKRLKRAQEREKWLQEHGVSEDDVNSELVVIEGRRNRKRVYFIDEIKSYQEIREGGSASKLFLPDELCTGYKIEDKEKETIQEMKKDGFDAYTLVDKFMESEEEETEV